MFNDEPFFIKLIKVVWSYTCCSGPPGTRNRLHLYHKIPHSPVHTMQFKSSPDTWTEEQSDWQTWQSHMRSFHVSCKETNSNAEEETAISSVIKRDILRYISIAVQYFTTRLLADIYIEQRHKQLRRRMFSVPWRTKVFCGQMTAMSPQFTDLHTWSVKAAIFHEVFRMSSGRNASSSTRKLFTIWTLSSSEIVEAGTIWSLLLRPL
jgi:hypothetical protein